MLELNNKQSADSLSVINDPFKKDKIKTISLHMGFYGTGVWSGNIEFVNGSTEGKQKIDTTTDFNNAVMQLKAIIDSIK